MTSDRRPTIIGIKFTEDFASFRPNKPHHMERRHKTVTQTQADSIHSCYLTVNEFARRIGVHPETVRAWEKTGICLPHHRTPGGHRRYTEDQVQILLRSRASLITEGAMNLLIEGNGTLIAKGHPDLATNGDINLTEDGDTTRTSGSITLISEKGRDDRGKD